MPSQFSFPAAILKIDISPYISEKSSDFHEILYTVADFWTGWTSRDQKFLWFLPDFVNMHVSLIYWCRLTLMLFTMFQDLLTVIQDCLQLFWQYLSSTDDDFNYWVYVLTLEVITGVVVFVRWHDKVGCRRQQQQRPTYYMFTFTHKPRPIVDLTPLSVFPVPVVALERSGKKFYRQVGFVYVTCNC